MNEVLLDLKTPNIEDAQKILTSYGVTSESVEIWGTGKPMREFLWSEDMADACVHIMESVDFKDLKSNQDDIKNTHINIGTGEDISIKDLAYLIKKTIGFTGDFAFNSDKPNGTMKKVTDVSKIHQLGWKHKVELEEGIQKVCKNYISLSI
jgi:GDP-L-fucose synthase